MKTKNYLSQLCLLVTLLLPIAVQAQFTYTTNSDNTINITAYTGSSSTPTIPDAIAGLPVASIGEFVFSGGGITSITIGTNLINIGFEAFGYSADLTAITVNPANPAYASAGGILFNKSQTMLIQYLGGLSGPYTIPGNVTSIADGAFSDCALGSVTIPGSVISIEDGAFYDCFVTAYTVDAANPAYASPGGILFNKNLTTLVQYPRLLTGPYTIPNSVTSIGYYAFVYSQDLTSITISNSVTSIGYGAFAYCDSLTNIAFGNGVASIGGNAFDDCAMSSVTIPGSVTSIGDGAFFNCYNLEGLYFQGNAPGLGGTNVFEFDVATVYYLLGVTGWGATYGGLPTAIYGFIPQSTFSNGSYIVTGLAAGLYHSLFLKSDGSLWSMGENGYGQLGIGTTTSTNRPQLVASNVMAVAGGGFHTLFVKGDGSLWAMGDNQYGELGDGTLNNNNRPEMIVPGGVVAVAAGVYHSLFLKSDNSLWGMGYNHDGQLGDGTFGSSNQTNRPEYIDTNVTAIVAGNYHSLYLKNGGIWFMGKNDAGQLGNGSYNSIYTHQEVVRSATAIAARGNHSLYLNGSTLFATGDNSQGEFGNGTYTSVNIPEPIATNVTTIAAGSNHTLYRTIDGILWGTGANNAGQLGDGTYTTINHAEQIVPAGVVTIAAGDQHSLFLESDGSLWGMGNNSGGEMGDGTFNNTNRPEQIIGPIVANGGFEMGNFDGWTLIPGDSDTMVAGAHSGSFAAQFHDLYLGGFGGSTASVLSQTLLTQAGAKYLLSFWVDGVAHGSVRVAWNGNLLTTESVGSGWTNLQFVVTATGANTALQFTFAGIFSHVTTTTTLDDVSVTMLPPTIIAELVGGSNVRLSFVGNANANYALERTFNLAPPIAWVPLSTNVTDGSGMLVFTNTAVVTTNNFWRVRLVP